MLGNHLLEFNNASPLEFGLLKGWSQDIGTWTPEMKQEFVNWDNSLPDEHIGDFAPPRKGLPFGGQEDAPGFGPGPYEDSYNGSGDRVYWGDRDVESVSSEWLGREEVDEVLAQFESEQASMTSLQRASEGWSAADSSTSGVPSASSGETGEMLSLIHISEPTRPY